jgi:hypothetical protein
MVRIRRASVVFVMIVAEPLAIAAVSMVSPHRTGGHRAVCSGAPANLHGDASR